jgi:eukaryotic-like serine/threonine-protein kinase
VSQPKPAVPDPTQIAGRYDVVQRLGAGAFGTVYKAKDKVLGRMVAIKTIRLEGLAAQGASLEELLERFNREARVSAQLKHPNIVTVYDVGNSDGLTYLAMEFIDGVGLDRLIANEGRLPVERAALIASQVADGLDFAHRHSVVHRDIKPANIMIEPGDRVKVTDFGIAKATDSGEHLTMTGSLLGTPSYMSPEQAKGAALDGRSDLFAVGCVLYEMLAGRKAFRGESITGLIFKIITEEPPAITDIDPLIPEAMVKIVTKAISKAPEARYQTGRELADDLATFTRGGSWPTMRQTETPTAPGSKPSPAVPAPTMVSPAAAAGAPPTMVASTPAQGAPAPAPKAPEPPPPPPPAPPRAPAPRPPSPPPVARPATPAAPTKSGGGAGLLIAVGLGLMLLFVGAGAGLWYVLTHRGGDKPVAPPTNVQNVPTAEPPVPTSAPPVEPPPTVEPPNTTANTTTPDVQPPPATLPPTTSRTQAPTVEPARTAKPPVQPDTTVADGTRYNHLDAEEAPLNGADIGSDVAGTYTNGQRNTGFGSRRPMNRRPASPRGQRAAEIPAVATVRHLMNAETQFHKKEGRYGSLADLAGRYAFLDVKPSSNSFQRKGYRFDLSVKGDGFEVLATPMGTGGRAFKGDDSGYITDAND